MWYIKKFDIYIYFFLKSWLNQDRTYKYHETLIKSTQINSNFYFSSHKNVRFKLNSKLFNENYPFLLFLAQLLRVQERDLQKNELREEIYM